MEEVDCDNIVLSKNNNKDENLASEA